MTKQPWHDLPDTPPTRAHISSEAATAVLEPHAADLDPPPAPPPRRDSPWWRVGGALVLTALLGAAAWVISDRSGAEATAAGDAPPTTSASTFPPSGGSTGPDELQPGAPDGRFDFFFGDGTLPPEIEQFLEENGFGPGDFPRRELPPEFEQFFEENGFEFFRNGELPPELRRFLEENRFGPEFFRERGFFNPEDFFGGDRGPFGEGFSFSFEGELPEPMQQLIEMLPGLVLAPDEAELAAAEELINELLADPQTPDEIRRFAESLADRLGVTVAG